MTKGHAPFCQIVGRQLNRHFIARQHFDVVLAHLARQVGQYFVALGDLHFECRVPHTLDYGSVHGDHVFFWDDVTSFHMQRSNITVLSS